MADEWKTLLAKSQRDIEKALESDFSGADQARKDITLRASLDEAKYKRSPEYMQQQIDIEKGKAAAWADRDKENAALRLQNQKELAKYKDDLNKKLARGGFTRNELDLHLNRVSHPDPEIDKYLKNKAKGHLAETGAMPMNLNAWTAARIKEYQKYWGEEPAGAPGVARSNAGPNPTVSESLMKGGSAAIGKAVETVGGLLGLAGTGLAHGANVATLGLPGMAYEAYTGKDTSFSNPVESAGELAGTAFGLLKAIPYGMVKGAQEIASTGAEFLGGMTQDVANTGTGESFQGPGWMPERIEAAMAEAAAYIAGEEDPEEIKKFITDPEIGSGIVQGLAHMHADITGGSVDDSLDILAGELAAQPDIVFMIPDLLGAWKYYRAGGFTGMRASDAAAKEAADTAVFRDIDTRASGLSDAIRGETAVGSDELLRRMGGEAAEELTPAAPMSAEELIQAEAARAAGESVPPQGLLPGSGARLLGSGPGDGLGGASDIEIAREAPTPPPPRDGGIRDLQMAIVGDRVDEYARVMQEAIDAGVDPQLLDSSLSRVRRAAGLPEELATLPGDVPQAPRLTSEAGKQSRPLAAREVPVSLASAEDLAATVKTSTVKGQDVLDAIVDMQSKDRYGGMVHLGELAETLGRPLNEIASDLQSLERAKLIQLDPLSDPRVFKGQPEKMVGLRSKLRGTLAFASVKQAGDELVAGRRAAMKELEGRRLDAEFTASAFDDPNLAARPEAQQRLTELFYARRARETGITPELVEDIGLVDKVSTNAQIFEGTPMAGESRVLRDTLVTHQNSAIEIDRVWRGLDNEFKITPEDSKTLQSAVWDAEQKATSEGGAAGWAKLERDLLKKGETGSRLLAYYKRLYSEVFEHTAKLLPEDARREGPYFPHMKSRAVPVVGISVDGGIDKISRVHGETYRMLSRSEGRPNFKPQPHQFWQYKYAREAYMHAPGGPIPMAMGMLEDLKTLEDIIPTEKRKYMANALREVIGETMGRTTGGKHTYDLAQMITKGMDWMGGTKKAAEISSKRNKYIKAYQALNDFLDGEGRGLSSDSISDAARKSLSEKRNKLLGEIDKAEEALTAAAEGTIHTVFYDLFGNDPTRTMVQSAVGSFVVSVLGFKPVAHAVMNAGDLTMVGGALAGKELMKNPVAVAMDATKGMLHGLTESGFVTSHLPWLKEDAARDYVRMLDDKTIGGRPFMPDADDMFGDVFADVKPRLQRRRKAQPLRDTKTARAASALSRRLDNFKELALIGLEGFEEVLSHGAIKIGDGIFRRLWQKHGRVLPGGRYDVAKVVDRLAPAFASKQLRNYWVELGSANPRLLRNEFAKWFAETTFVGRSVLDRLAITTPLRMVDESLVKGSVDLSLMFTRHGAHRIGLMLGMLRNGKLRPDEFVAATMSMSVGAAMAHKLLSMAHPGEAEAQEEWVDPRKLTRASEAFAESESLADAMEAGGMAWESVHPVTRRLAKYSMLSAAPEVLEKVFGGGYEPNPNNILRYIPGVGLAHSLKKGQERDKALIPTGRIMEQRKKWKRIWIPDEEPSGSPRRKRRKSRYADKRKKRTRKRER